MFFRFACCALVCLFATFTLAQETKEPVLKQKLEQQKSKKDKEAKPKPTPEALPIELQLFRPDSLVGWDHGEDRVVGWTINQGILTSTLDSSELVSGLVLNEFELSFQWRCDAQAALILNFHGIDSGNTLKVHLKEGVRSGLTLDGGDFKSGSKTLEAPTEEGMFRQAVIRRQQGKFSLHIDENQIYEFEIDANRRFGFAIQSKRGAAQLANVVLKEPLGNPIFNGDDLTGWWTPGKLESWGIEQGELIWKARGGSYIRTEKQYANYTLSFEYTINPGGNSGVGIRTAPEGWPSGDGMELQIYDKPGFDKHSAMAIYGNLPPIARADKSGQYNQVVIKAHGRQISAWINGELVQQVNTYWEPELRHRNLQGWIGFQDHGAKIRARNIRVKEEVAGLGLDQWYAKREEPAAKTVLARLMNSERLAQDDGLISNNVRQSVRDKKQTVAELEGPGALVQLSIKKPNGTLQFYFDDEQQPRLTVEAKNLQETLPHVPGHFNGVVTYLGYEQSLQIVAVDAVGSSVELNTVQFSRGSVFSGQVNTYSPSESPLPRGLHSALEYRSFQMGKGTVRQYDPFDRLTSEKLTLKPGDSLNAVNAQGRGVVQWLQLNANSKQLESDDLWIEITVDGESLPAVAAPVRYYFAGMHAGKNFQNYLVTNRSGIYNRLAIPFGKGVRINLSNRGNKEIKDVQLTASVEVVNDTNRSPRKQFNEAMRLRGIYQAAGDNSIISQTGTGRWIGFVMEDKSLETQISVQVDDVATNPIEQTSLSNLLGSSQKEIRNSLSGRSSGLAWRYFLLTPVEFQESLKLTSESSNELGGRLGLFYVNP
ncbi:MAG: family 16 glycoside hydrolase [Pirellulales bacterium]